MAKSANAKKLPSNPLVVGKAIPTPEIVTQRKSSVASKSKLVEGEASSEEQEEEKQHSEETAPKQVKEEEEEKQD